MWELALVVLQVACLAIFVAAAIVSISFTQHADERSEPKLKRAA